MLVLGRKIGQKIHVGNDIVLTVVAIEGDVVKLGIDAPKHVPVHRSEVFDEIRRENEAARFTRNQLKNLKK